MPIKTALAGNPNCGKTTMFNDLTGSSQYVGNWPGVTVEKKEGRLRGHKDVTVVDLPGIYSLSPYTLEEVVTRNFLVNEKPDVIIDIVDASNLERNLYLTTQLVEVGIPVVIALNMMDVVNKSGDRIDVKELSSRLGCDVIETSAVKGLGSQEVAQRAIQLAQAGKASAPRHSFSKEVEGAVSSIQSILAQEIPSENVQWYAIKFTAINSIFLQKSVRPPALTFCRVSQALALKGAFSTWASCPIPKSNSTTTSSKALRQRWTPRTATPPTTPAGWGIWPSGCAR